MKKRLTTKNTRLTNWLSTGHITKENEELFCNCYNKLVHIEDLEEELGIDVTIVFKALKNGIWVKDFNGIEQLYIDYICESALVVEYWSFDETHYVYYHFEDYGKIWALTKEELEENDAYGERMDTV